MLLWTSETTSARTGAECYPARLMKVRDLGEFGLIARLAETVADGADERLIVGIGDDAAVWRAGDQYLIATTDTMVSGVHFLPGVASWRDVGWKALAVNVSDIAAMGGGPEVALVTLHLPPDTDVAVLDDVYDGMRACAEIYGVTVAGGDVVRSGVLAINVALLGEAVRSSDGHPLLLRRDAAEPGMLVAVTAPLGGSAGGLRLLREIAARGGTVPAINDEAGGDDPHDVLLSAHLHPWPRVDAGDFAVRAGVDCGMDISDGLVQDLRHICQASGVSADVRLADIPVEPALTQLYPDDARMLAATGGEDYELLLVGGEGALALADGALRGHLGMEEPQVHVIGRITGRGEPGVHLLDDAGREIDVDRGGWDHLAAGGA
jgi:thiamine-monophosphate kinase